MHAIAIAAAFLAAGHPPIGPIYSIDINLKSGNGPHTIAAADATAVVRVRGVDDNRRAVASVKLPGAAPLTVVIEDADLRFPITVTIGKLSLADRAPSVLFEGLSGGAHCCVERRLITIVGSRAKTVSFPDADGEPRGFPHDVDGDGTADFVGVDERFNYAFGSYAGSVPPPLILNVIQGRITDVSTRIGFRPLFTRFTTAAREACRDVGRDDNGACAGYVAGAARLGRFQPAIREASRYARPPHAMRVKGWEGIADVGSKLPVGCKVDDRLKPCPKGREINFRTFPAALRWFLRSWGYIP